MFHFITARDHRLMRRVHRWRPPRWVRFWALAATRAGDHWLWWFVAALVMLFGGAQRFRAVAAEGSAVATSMLLFQMAKRITGRKRPCEFEPHCWANLLPRDQFSFPSGHTMTAFSAAVSLSPFYRDVWPFLLFCAVSIGISRILLGMHFLSDVIAGAALGSGVGYAAWRLMAR